MFEPRELLLPYPGLRPFGSDEVALFFGREAHVSRLIEILHRQRFLAVVGPSGAGKSSLVKAGLLPALVMGWPGEVSDWRIAILRPGDRPLRRLSEALLKPDVLGPELGATGFDTQGHVTEPASLPALIEGELRRTPQALEELVADADRQRPGRPAFNLLVLVDQFEELFRYADGGRRQVNEAETFVNLLLAAASAQAGPALRVHVAVTMRTDAFHECARFLDLPEAINHGQYLVPRLKPDELRRAITEPARVFDGQVLPAVVDRLVADVQRAPDELPMLQHALSRMWASASARNAGHPELTEDDLTESGGVSTALSQHADQLYAGLTPEQQALADTLFRAITGKADGTQADTRRPQRLSAIARFAGLPVNDWPRFEPVLQAFAQEGANFLSYAQPLGPDTVIDLSHEALIRQWDRLRALAAWEADLADQYRRWRNRSEDHRIRGGSLLEGADLEAALEWREGWRETNPVSGRLAAGGNVARRFHAHAGWMERYALTGASAQGAPGDEFQSVLAFIDESDAADVKRVAAEKAAAEEKLALMQSAQAAQLAHERERAESAALQQQMAEQQQRIAEEGRQRARRWLAVAVLIAMLAVAAFVIAWQFKRSSDAHADEAKTAAAAAKDAAASANAEKLRADDRAKAADAAASRAIAAEQAASQAAADAQANAASAEAAASREAGAKRQAIADRKAALEATAQTRLALRSATSLRLAIEGQAQVSNTRPGGPERGLWQILAASKLMTGVEQDSALQAAYLQMSPRLLKLMSSSAVVSSVAISPDGSLIVSGSGDNTLRLWDARSGAPIGEPLKGHSNSVWSVAFSPDGSRIVSGSDDETLRLWPVFSGWADALCSKLTRNMPREDWARWVGNLPYKRQCPDLLGPPDEPDPDAQPAVPPRATAAGAKPVAAPPRPASTTRPAASPR